MTMKSLDVKNEEIKQKLEKAMQSENQEDMINAFVDFANDIQQSVLEDARKYQMTQDDSILQSRGVHTLTSEENKFYQAWIDASKEKNPRQALTNLDIAMPFTVIDNVMEDLKANHPLLDLIDFQNMAYLKKLIYNKQGKQLAVWGKIGAAITEQLAGTIGYIDITLNKLSAFIPVAKDMLDVGPQWIDSYVRAILSESIAYGLEEGIINGTGVDMPIGMIKSVADGVSINSVTGYPNKDLIPVDSFSDEVIGDLFSRIATNPIDATKTRNVNLNDLVLICNPFDYFKKVGPAINAKRKEDAFYGIENPFDIKNVITSEQMERDRAVIGISKKYAMGLGSGSQKGGKIEYSDEYKFLEDERYYIVKLTANGRAYDDNAFLYLDISKLKATPLKVDTSVETLKTISLTSTAGTSAGDTHISTTNVLTDGNSYKYKIGDGVIVPVVNQIVTNWSAWDGTSDITAENGKKIVIIEVNSAGQVKGAGYTTVTTA